MFDSNVVYTYDELVRKAKSKCAGPEGDTTYALLPVADRLDRILKIIEKEKLRNVSHSYYYDNKLINTVQT